MDLLAIKPDTAIVDIKHPSSGKPVGLKIECVSLDDDRVKAVERQIRNRALRSGRNNTTAEKLEAVTTEIQAAAIVGWTWSDELELGGMKNPELNKSNVEKVLGVPWIAKQVNTVLDDETAFFGSSEIAA